MAQKAKQPVSPEALYELLERKYEEFNSASFIDGDPVGVPHRFSKKQDIEIMALWTAVLSWGNRKSIITSASRLADWMDNAPHDFVLSHSERDLQKFLHFVHRTFNATDALYFIEFFKHYYRQHESLEDAFLTGVSKKSANLEAGLTGFHELFFSLEDAPHRTRKHIATPARKSSTKRLNMFLRWMVRHDDKGVDFGLWKKIKPAQLLIPLDIHVDRVARQLGLLKRKQTDWLAVLELTENLKQFDPKDPVKYDFALFGMGVWEKAGINSL